MSTSHNRFKEPFLINPAPRGKKRKSGSQLPSGLLKQMIKKYGPKRAMAEAWKSVRGGSATRMHKNTWPKHKAQHKAASLKGWSQRKSGAKGSAYAEGYVLPRHNPFLGEEVLVVGMNPKPRKRRKARKSTRSHSVARYHHNPRRRRVVRRRHNPVARRRHSVARYRHNPVRRRRSYRRNPMALAMGGGMSITEPQTLLVPIAAVIGGRLAVTKLPALLGFGTPGLTQSGVKIGIAVGGGMLLKKVIGGQNAMIFTIVGLASVAEDLLNQYVFKTTLAGFDGFGAFPLEQGMGAYVDNDGGAYGGGDSPY